MCVLKILALACLGGWVAALGEVPEVCPSALDLEDPQATNASLLCVALGMEKGKLVVRSASSKFYPSKVLDRGKPVSKSKHDALEKDLVNEAMIAAMGLNNLYYYGLTDTERAAEDQGKLDPGVTRPMDTLTPQSWDDLVATYTDWAAKVPDRRIFVDALGAAMERLKLDPTGLFTRSNGIDADVGSVTLSAADLSPEIGNPTSLPICFKDFAGRCSESGVVLNRKRIEELLSDFPGQPWRQTEIKERLDSYYTNRGLVPENTVSPASDQSRRLFISESFTLTRILWAKDLDAKPVELEEFLSVLLSRQDFAFYLRTPSVVTDVALAGVAAFRALPYLGMGADPKASTLESAPPLLNQTTLQSQQAALQAMGLVLTLQQDSDPQGRKVGLLVQQKVPDGPKENPASAPVALPPKPTESGTAHAGSPPTPGVPPATLPAPNSASTPPPPPPKDLKNYIGFGFQYRPGQGVRPLLQFERSRLDMGSATASLSGQVGGNATTVGNGGALASGTAAVDNLFFGSLHHRLSAEFNGGTDLTQQRILSSELTNERRTGAYAHLEYEILAGNENSQLTISGDARRESIGLTPAQQTEVRSNLNTLEAGATFALQGLTNPHPYRLHIEPSVRFGFGYAPANTFRLLAGEANLNQHLFDHALTTVDLTGRFQYATGETPLFEQPSLGGGESVRGFRTDDAIGKTLWSLQSELWWNVPQLFGMSRFANFARTSVRLASFFDVAGLSRPAPASKSGIRTGPGVGIRVFEGPIALKVDWAYGLGDGAFGSGHGRFYVGVSTTRTF
jgi:hypothetical protein